MNKNITVVSWNVNGIRAAQKKGFVPWLNESGADIIAVQETKAQPEQLDEELLAVEGFTVHFASAQKKGYSGVAIYSKVAPIRVETLGIDEFDAEGRVLIAYFEEFALINCYFPNSQAEGKRIAYKTGFNEAIQAKCEEIVASGGDVILCGDYNVAHQPIDLANPKRNEKNPGYLPEERSWMDSFLAAGFVDTFRHFCDEPEHYSWWSYRFGARERNIGWRLDYHCVNERLMAKVSDALILPEVMGSDHCPVVLKLIL